MQARMSLRHLALAFGLVCFHSAVVAQSVPPALAGSPAVCGVPLAGEDGWRIATPESVGFDDASLCALIERVTSFPAANVHSVLVVRRGALVFEQYFAGEDQTWGRPAGRIEFGPDVKHDLRSVSKGVVSLLTGIALDRKLVANVDEPVFGFFPEYAELRTPAKDRITLRHLLTMSSGVEWDENRPYTDSANSEIAMIRSPDRYRYVLERPVQTPPGKAYNYNGGGTELLGRVVRGATGQPLEDFAREALFEPLGITDFEWVKYGSDRIAAAASGLRLRPRDMAKLGQLVLAGGQWNGRQIVSKAWIDASIASQIVGSDLYFYGYQWWLGRSLVGGREVTWAAGVGLGGQRIFIVPEFDLVMVMTAGLYTNAMQRWVPLELLNQYVLAAVRDR